MNKNWRRLARCSAAAMTAAILLAGCAAQRANTRGMELIGEGERTQGLAELEKAVRLDPSSARYRLDYLNERARQARNAIEQGDAARAAEDPAAAREQYLAALRIDPGNELARRALALLNADERRRVAIGEAERLAANGDLEGARDRLRVAAAEAPADQIVARALVQMQERVDKKAAEQDKSNAANSVMKRPVTLQFRDANVRMVFEALSRTTGLNVILDRDVRADLKTTIFVRDASVEDTVDLILLQNQLDKKVLNANTLFIYPATPAKQKEYQDLRVRTFQLSNADAKYIQSVLKSVLKVKDMALDEKSNTLVIRDTPDAIAVAEKVVKAHDLADAEVMLEVEVLEVSRERLTNLGIQWPTGVSVSTPESAGTVGGLRALTRDELLISKLAAGVNLQLQDSDANLLASPRIRARHKEKAKILIGDKVPVITNSVTPTAGGTAVVTGSVQYIDVGIKLDVEPYIYLEGDVGIKLNLEVSNIVKTIQNDASGTLAYQIGTRSASTSLRLRDGETQVLGGLISDEERDAASKVPGLGQLPILGRLFSNHNGDKVKKEILLSITPHILRAQAMADGRLRNVYSGSESMVRQNPLRIDPMGAAAGAPVGVQPVVPGATGGGSVGGSALPPTPTRAGQPARPAPMSAAPGQDEAAQTPGSAPEAPPQPAAGPAAATEAPVEFSWEGPTDAKVGREFEVALAVNTDREVNALSLLFRFDPLVLVFLEAQVADLGAGAGVTAVQPAIDRAGGTVRIELHAGAGQSFRGQGQLLKLRFAGRMPREQTRLTLARIEAKDEAGVVGGAQSAAFVVKIGS